MGDLHTDKEKKIQEKVIENFDKFLGGAQCLIISSKIDPTKIEHIIIGYSSHNSELNKSQKIAGDSTSINLEHPDGA